MVLSKCTAVGKRGFIRTLTANNLLTTITGVTVQLNSAINITMVMSVGVKAFTEEKARD